MLDNIRVVVHPRGVYFNSAINRFVCLTRENPRRKTPRILSLVANQNGPEIRLQSDPTLTTRTDEVRYG